MNRIERQTQTLASKQVVRCERTFKEIHLKGLKTGFYTTHTWPRKENTIQKESTVEEVSFDWSHNAGHRFKYEGVTFFL